MFDVNIKTLLPHDSLNTQTHKLFLIKWTAIVSNNRTKSFAERHPRPSVTLYAPDTGTGPSVSLQCVVMGVVPAEARVFWVVGESEMTGWTESSWTHTNHTAKEYMRSHISIPSQIWMEAQNVECVVEVDGRRVSKSFKQGD